MSFRRHIDFCNNAEIEKYLPLVVGQERLGWVRRDRLDRLREFTEAFEVYGHGLRMNSLLPDAAARSGAMKAVAESLAASGDVPRLRGELYPAATRWGDEPRFVFDRALASWFGFRSWGVHMQGYVNKPDGMHLWIGRRAPDKDVDPDKLDNTAAGGQPAGLSLRENLIKECAEEADIPGDMAERATPAGFIAYAHEDALGLKPDAMFVYDLEIQADFTPNNADGEMSGFELLPAGEVVRLVRDTDEFKFDCNLVLIDFFIRHGLIDPDSEPDYPCLCEGLHIGESRIARASGGFYRY